MQSRGMSAVEAVSNVLLGWLMAFATQLVLFPMVGLQATPSQNLAISCAFTFIVSAVPVPLISTVPLR